MEKTCPGSPRPPRDMWRRRAGERVARVQRARTSPCWLRSTAFFVSRQNSARTTIEHMTTARLRSRDRLGIGLCLLSSWAMLATLAACSSDEKKGPETVDLSQSPFPDSSMGQIFNPDETGTDGLDPSEVCAGQEAGTELAPAIVELLVDTSLSMDEQAPGSRRSKWLATRDVMLEGIDLMPATTSVGVVFFPDVEVGAMPCFDSQADVAIQALGGTSSTQRSQIRDAFGKESPRGSTPTHDAYKYTLAQVAASTLPGQRFLVLVTDGVPTYALNCKGSGQQQDPADPTPLIPEAASAL